MKAQRETQHIVQIIYQMHYIKQHHILVILVVQKVTML